MRRAGRSTQRGGEGERRAEMLGLPTRVRGSRISHLCVSLDADGWLSLIPACDNAATAAELASDPELGDPKYWYDGNLAIRGPDGAVAKVDVELDWSPMFRVQERP